MLVHIPMIVTSCCYRRGPPAHIRYRARLQGRQRFGVRSRRRHESNDKAVLGRRTAGEGQLETQWSGFVNSDRIMCTTETVGEKADAGATPPSYFELLTCVQDAQLARKLPKN
jgi:hypothetical protein